MRKKDFIKESIVILIFILTAFIISLFIRLTIVEGVSMNPTLQDKQLLMFYRNYYKTHDVERYDIVVFKTKDNRLLIKRVIGLPGERLKIDNKGNIIINDKKLNEPISFETIQDSGIAKDEIKLNENEYFLLGDNRNASIDSRNASIGVINKLQIEGKVKHGK